MYGGYGRKYALLPEDDEKCDMLTSPAHAHSRSHSWRDTFGTIYSLTVHFFLLLFAGLVFRNNSCTTKNILKSELPFAQDHVSYIEKTFAPGGFTTKPTPPNPFLGPPSVERDALWESLYDVGIVVLSADEVKQLSITTTRMVDEIARPDDSRYLVTLEVFHQLHCLDYLRHASYSENHHPNESEWSKTRHVDHCADYLRQVLTCHSDLTPITMEHIPGAAALPMPNPAPYRPDFAIHHTCRDFDLIYEWALKRNSSGYKVA